MSDENSIILSSEKDENLETADDARPFLHSEDSATENVDAPSEQDDQENRQLRAPVHPKEQSQPLPLTSVEKNMEAEDSSSEQELGTAEASIETKSLERTGEVLQLVSSTASSEIEMSLASEQELGTSEASSGTKSLERTGEVLQPVASTASSEIAMSLASSTDKALEEVIDNIKTIYEGLKGMKLSAQENLGSASGKKGHKPATPRAKSTPVKPLTSPPLTRSRSRDLKKFPSTPSSPGRIASRNNSESDSDEIKGARGRRREKRN